MRAKKSTVLPFVLLVYLGIMAYIGWPAYANGQTSPLQYFGIIGLTLAIIILLHFSLKRRERLRRERENDILGNNKEDKNADLSNKDKQ